MIKKALSVISVAVLLITPPSLLAWGTATHVYLAKQLGHRLGYANIQEMYGSALPDFPALLFGSPYQELLYQKTHYEFMKVVNLAPLGYKKAVAYGFASHNEMWGADSTAHISARLSPGKGYVTAKDEILQPNLVTSVTLFLTDSDIPATPGMVNQLSMMLADTCVEAAVDLLVSENEDRLVGAQMILASDLRAWYVPALLVAAYAGDLAKTPGVTYWQAASTIMNAEQQARTYLKGYGVLLTQQNRLDLLAELIAQMAEAVLAQQYSITVDVPVSLTKPSLEQAISLVKDNYDDELAATLEYLRVELHSQGIETSALP